MATLERMRQQTAEYLKLPGTTLETERSYLENSFLLTEVFRRLMQQGGLPCIDDSRLHGHRHADLGNHRLHSAEPAE